MFPKPFNEPGRLDALASFAIDEAEPDTLFERTAAVARSLFDVPTALVSLVESERQWIKASNGLEAQETSRAQSFCAHAIMSDDVLVVPDATRDPRFADNPLVVGEPHLRFYVGAPLATSAGFRIGTICVLDQTARERPEPEKVEALRALGALLVDQLEARRLLSQTSAMADGKQQEAEAAHRAKRDFLALMSHELRTPLNAIIGFGELLASHVTKSENADYAREVCSSAEHLLGLIDRVLAFSLADRGELMIQEEEVELRQVVWESLAAMAGLAQLSGCRLSSRFEGTASRLTADGVQIRQILLNLVSNAIHSGAKNVEVLVEPPSDMSLSVSVIDDGCGLAAEQRLRVMGPFSVGENILTRSGQGLGLGLPLTSRLVELHGGILQLMPGPSGSGLEAKAVFPAWRVLKPEAAVVA